MPAKKKPSKSAELKGGSQMKGQTCPTCGKPKLTLIEAQTEVPYFGKLYLFSMQCEACGFKKSDIEPENRHTPERWEFIVEKQADLAVRIVKSAEAKVQLGRLGSIEPGAAAEGYITNIEGLLDRFKQQVQHVKDSAESDDERKAAKRVLKKLQRVLWGDDPLKVVVDDPSGASAIISERATRKALKGKAAPSKAKKGKK